MLLQPYVSGDGGGEVQLGGQSTASGSVAVGAQRALRCVRGRAQLLVLPRLLARLLQALPRQIPCQGRVSAAFCSQSNVCLYQI